MDNKIKYDFYICFDQSDSDIAKKVQFFLQHRFFTYSTSTPLNSIKETELQMKNSKRVLFLHTKNTLVSIKKTNSSIYQEIILIKGLDKSIITISFCKEDDTLETCGLPCSSLYVSDTADLNKLNCILSVPKIKPLSTILENYNINLGCILQIARNLIPLYSTHDITFLSERITLTANNTDNLNLLHLYKLDVGDRKNILLHIVLIALIFIICKKDKLGQKEIIDIRSLWELIYIVLMNRKLKCYSSPQGFIAIPLYTHTVDGGVENLIRLHIWHHQYKFKSNAPFSIHTHQTYTRSWVLNGSIQNWDYNVRESLQYSKLTFFKPLTLKTENYMETSIKSILGNTYKYADKQVQCITNIHAGSSYDVPANIYHSIAINPQPKDNELLATLFYFNTALGKTEHPYILGPSNIDYSEYNRMNELAFPSEIIDHINSIIRSKIKYDK